MSKGPKMDSSQNKTHKWPVNTRRSAQHHGASEKRRLKPHVWGWLQPNQTDNNECPDTCWWAHEMVQFLWETLWQFFTQLNTAPVWPSGPHLGVSMRTETHVHTKACPGIFTAVLFITARKWQQPKCPSTDEPVNKRWYSHTMEYYSGIKRNEVRMHATT